MRLRPFAASDLEDLAAMDSEPGVARYRNDGKPAPREVTENVTLPALMSARGGFDVWAWAACAKDGGAFLGLATLRPDAPGVAELGYRFRTAFWGQGLATEAARAVLALGFRDWRLDRIYAQAMAVNLGSRRVMEKAGLRHVRTFYVAFEEPISGTEEGETEYELRRADWVLKC